MSRSEAGYALPDAIFGVMLVLVLFLGTVQIVFVVYARAVIQASAHEGARAAVERGASNAAATKAALDAVRRSAGGLIDHVRVIPRRERVPDGSLVILEVAGMLRPLGPLPLRIPVAAVAHSFDLDDPR